MMLLSTAVVHSFAIAAVNNASFISHFPTIIRRRRRRQLPAFFRYNVNVWEIALNNAIHCCG